MVAGWDQEPSPLQMWSGRGAAAVFLQVMAYWKQYFKIDFDIVRIHQQLNLTFPKANAATVFGQVSQFRMKTTCFDACIR